MLFAFAFMVVLAVVLARLTLQPSPASVALAHTNLHPGRSLQVYLDQPALRDAVKQIGGNLLLGVPFGLLLPVLAPRKAPRTATLCATSSSSATAPQRTPAPGWPHWACPPRTAASSRSWWTSPQRTPQRKPRPASPKSCTPRESRRSSAN
nr:VanZ family protein [Streptomyces cyaneus]